MPKRVLNCERRADAVASRTDSRFWTKLRGNERARSTSESGVGREGFSLPAPSIFRVARGIRQDRCGDSVMKTTLIVIQNEADHADAKRLVEKLMGSSDPQDGARMVAQARLVEAYERAQWPRTAPALPVLLSYLMDQHSLSRADLVPLLGTSSRVSEVLNGKRDLSMTMVRRLRERFNVSADLLVSRGRARSRAAA